MGSRTFRSDDKKPVAHEEDRTATSSNTYN